MEVNADSLPSRFVSPDQNFVDAILGRDEVQVPPVCGLRVIQLTEAAWESAEKNGRPVRVKRTRPPVDDADGTIVGSGFKPASRHCRGGF